MKYTLTPELAVLIRTLRTQNGVASKELAGMIGRSASYISKLESGGVKKVEKSDLTRILKAVTRQDDFFEGALPDAFRTFSAIFRDTQIYRQIWLLMYDVVDRMVTVPAEMSEELRQMAVQENLTASDLTGRINENRDSDAPKNAAPNVFFTAEQSGALRLFMRVRIDESTIAPILAGECETNYHSVYVLTWFLLRSKKFGDVKTKLPKDQAVSLLRDTAVVLGKYDIRTLTRFDQMLFSPGFVEHQTHRAYNLDAVSTGYAEDILSELESFSKYDAVTVAESLEGMLQNLRWDPAFMMKIMRMPFSETGELSYTRKKELLDEISSQIEERKKLPDMEKKLEIY